MSSLDSEGIHRSLKGARRCTMPRAKVTTGIFDTILLDLFREFDIPVDFLARGVHNVLPDFSRLYRVSDRGHIRIRRLDFITPQDTVGPA